MSKGDKVPTVRHMQGVSAHIEKLKSNDLDGRHECRYCFYYVEKQCCCTRSYYYGKSYCSGRYCQYFSKRNVKDYEKCKTKNQNIRNNIHHEKICNKKVVSVGNWVKIRDVKSGSVFVIGPIREFFSDNYSGYVKRVFLYKCLGDKVKFNNGVFSIEEII